MRRNKYVRFTLDNDRESRFPQKAMSALPPKADMCSARGYVRFGPKADITLVAARLENSSCRSAPLP